MPTEEQKNVVLVEDDASVSKSILALLDSGGFRAVAFPSAEALLRAMMLATAGCLVLDIGLPGLSGFELYQRLVESDSRLPVIFITGDDNPSAAKRARELGAVAYLLKPMSGPDLLNAVTGALRLGRGIGANQLNN